MRPTIHRMPLALAALALLLPLLASCGGGAPGAAPAEVSRGVSDEGPPGAPRPAAPDAQAAMPLPTTAPAATAAPAAAAPGSIGGAERPALPAPPTPQPTMAAYESSAQAQPIRAGEVDDNADYRDYLDYLVQRSGGTGFIPVDVSERIILTVLNDQQRPVIDARVRVFAGQTQVFAGRTYAGGKTILFPRALGVSPNTSELRFEIEKEGSSAAGTIPRYETVERTIILPAAQAIPQQPRLDVLFLLDATGSMGDEIARIQQTIDGIAERIDGIEPRPELRLALVAYRDRGDEYLTRVYSNFTPDVAAFRASLLQVRADGGGDTPEDLNAALEVALRQLSWGDDAVRLTFLVADAPPQLGYGQEFDYTDAAREAVVRGVKIYPIAASNTDPTAEYVFRQLAQQTLASFIFLTYEQGQSSGAPGDTTQMQVDPAEFTVQRLDDLVVRIVEREMAEAVGAR